MFVLGVCSFACLALSLTLGEETHDGVWQCTGAVDSQCSKPYGVDLGTTDSEVSYEQLKAILSGGNVQLFDVRDPDEFIDGRIPGSVNLPLGELQEDLRLSPGQFHQMFGVSPPQKDDTNIVLYCQRGRRSASALNTMSGLGFNRVRHYAGGYADWVQREQQ
ncbi:thiosulfate:glutathione sulfurtransferase-like [Osmerus eperlanus]|uniref:thiosulfate:glutathione sulfurtransferase-like n=1 Tax=Osmerus eperlanus TaxID=29151 RepID=UPI002E11CCF8